MISPLGSATKGSSIDNLRNTIMKKEVMKWYEMAPVLTRNN